MDYTHDLSAMHAALAVLRGTGSGTLKTTVFNKAMFYADLEAMLELGAPISGCRYVALENGPVVYDYKSLFQALRASGWAEQRVTSAAHPISILSLPKLDAITPVEAEIGEAWGRRLAGMTAAGVSAKSHNNPGWIAAWGSRSPGEQGDEIDLVLAMQELLDDEDDAWLDEPAPAGLAHDPMATTF